jgi:hypothetical protein
VFAIFAVIIWVLCTRGIVRTDTEEQEAAGGGDDDTTVHQLQSNEAGDGWVDRAPSSTVAGAAAVEMALPVRVAEPPVTPGFKDKTRHTLYVK